LHYFFGVFFQVTRILLTYFPSKYIVANVYKNP
jgi:hypothetical protein